MVKKENCKDCFDSKTGPLCDRHMTEESKRFVTPIAPLNVHISYWLDEMAAWLATRDNKNFEYLCKLLTGARFEKMILDDQPPKKEEPKVHVCSARGHLWCVLAENAGKASLDDLSKIRNEHFAPKEDRFHKLLDLRNELISAGFTRKEANYLVQPLVTHG